MERLNVGGTNEVLLDNKPLKVTDQPNKNTLTAVEDYDNDGVYWYGPDETVAGADNENAVSEFRLVYDRVRIGTGDGITRNFTFQCPFCPDDGDATSESTTTVRRAITAAVNVLTTSTTGYAVADDDTLAGYLIDKDYRSHDWNGAVPTTSGTIAVFYNDSTNAVPVTDWGSTAGIHGDGTDGITWDGSKSPPEATVRFVNAPPDGTVIRMSFRTIRHTIPEHSSLESVTRDSGSWDNWRRYFVAGQKITFGGTVPTDMEVRYQKVTDYEPGTQVELVADPPNRVTDLTNDQTYSTIRFNDVNNQPGPGTSGLIDTEDTIIGVEYEFLPEMPDLINYKSLSGGSNGDTLTAGVLYDELDKAYPHIENYPVDVIVPMGATIDATRTVADPTTGLERAANAGFHTQLADFLNELTTNVNETVGIIGVEAPLSNDPGTIATWVDNLVDITPGVATKAANVMAAFDERLVSVCAFEPIFGNDLENLTYSANGAAAYAGLISALPARLSPINKAINSLVDLRYRLSNRQLERLTDARYVTARSSVAARGQFVITDDPTAAAPGSDFESLSTVRIVVEAMNVVRAVSEPFIGQGNTPAEILAMRTAITSGLRAMVDASALNAFDFEIISTPEMRARHLIDIELVLVPAFSIKQIRTFIRLKASL
jgi:hypothetical protein